MQVLEILAISQSSYFVPFFKKLLKYDIHWTEKAISVPQKDPFSNIGHCEWFWIIVMPTFSGDIKMFTLPRWEEDFCIVDILEEKHLLLL